ncbi:MAG: thiol peroxidase [Microbacteriaceae bacterium]|nr:thiol peroxidase [Microbacteriaceae bacterium]
MTEITLRGNAVNTVGSLPEVGAQAPDITLVGSDLGEVSLQDYRGKTVVLNIFPSIDTGVCASSVREFNKRAAELADTAVLCVSRDLPFALGRFCGAEDIENVAALSDFRSDLGEKYGVTMADGPLQKLLSRSVVVIDKDGKIAYTEQVPEIGQEPDYDAALAAVKEV